MDARKVVVGESRVQSGDQEPIRLSARTLIKRTERAVDERAVVLWRRDGRTELEVADYVLFEGLEQLALAGDCLARVSFDPRRDAKVGRRERQSPR
jgi:hypothetical protein